MDRSANRFPDRSPERSADAGRHEASEVFSTWFQSGVSISFPVATSTVSRFLVEFWHSTEINLSSSNKTLMTCVGGTGDSFRLGSSTGALTNEVIAVLDTQNPGNRRTGVLNITIPQGRNVVEFVWNSGASRYDIILNGVGQTESPSSGGHVNARLPLADFTFSLGSEGGVLESVVIERSDAVVHTYVPRGNQDSDWEDLTGGLDGTVVGAPALARREAGGWVKVV